MHCRLMPSATVARRHPDRLTLLDAGSVRLPQTRHNRPQLVASHKSAHSLQTLIYRYAHVEEGQ